MKIEHVEVYGFKASLRGMRNPMNSWARSDSIYGDVEAARCSIWGAKSFPCDVPELPSLGEADLELALSLIKAGGAHRKFLRMICVWWDITIPRCVWQELDTYKVATVRNSCSTMHKLGSRDLEIDDFEGGEIDMSHLELLNHLAAEYRDDRNPERLHRLKMHLPESFLQKATFAFNYETAMRIWFDRHDHRMPEWGGPNGICDWILRLPYMMVFIGAVRAGR